MAAAAGSDSADIKTLELPPRDATGHGTKGTGGVMDPDVAAFAISGLASATFTPFGDDGSVNLSGIEADADFLSSHGVKTVFINGTSGESMSLSSAERMEIAEAWVAAAKKNGMVVVNHVATPSIAETESLAEHAQKIGCDAISLMPPIFFKPKDEAHLVDWMKVAAAKAPKLPLYYYHFPVLSGVTVDVERLLIQVEEQGLSTFRGFKWTFFDTHQMERALSFGDGRYQVCNGRDEGMLAGLALGCQASIGNGFNYMAGVYQRMRAAWSKGDLKTARLEQSRACQTVALMQDPKYKGVLTCCKAIHELRGVPVGNTRKPLPVLTAELKAELRKDLEKIGFFEWCD